MPDSGQLQPRATKVIETAAIEHCAAVFLSVICAPSATRRRMVCMESISLMRIAWLERALDGLHQIARKRRRSGGLPAHLVIGIEGEDAVLFYLQRKGYTVVARRWSSGDVPGDVDLIAWHGPMLCFIEVKTRTAHDMTPAETAVNEHKRNVLRRLARRYVRQLPQITAPPMRFDVVSVYQVPGREREFQHFEGSFGWGDSRRD